MRHTATILPPAPAKPARRPRVVPYAQEPEFDVEAFSRESEPPESDWEMFDRMIRRRVQEDWEP